MKYETIKGSEKDFEGAPEWATKLLGETCVSKKAFAGDLGGVAMGAYKENPRYWWKLNERNMATIIAERRPITESVVWLNLDECDGSEYLGPVIGKEMECHAKDGSIFVVVVVAFDGDLPIVKTRLHGNYFGCDPSQLKPIRSPEDVARDEVGLAIYYAINWNSEGELVSPSRMEDYKKAYDAIAAGKIPCIEVKRAVSADDMWRAFEKNSDMEDVHKLIYGEKGK